MPHRWVRLPPPLPSKEAIMKAELVSRNEVFGVELTAEGKEDDKALRRFWEGGVKVNAVTERPDGRSSLQLTFADLIGK